MIYLHSLASWNTPFDASVHAVNEFWFESVIYEENLDDDIVKPNFKITAENPGITGLKNLIGKYYTLSEQKENGDVHEIARGRIISLPSAILGKLIDLDFWCLPPSEETVLKAFANGFRIGEVDYDPDAPEADRAAADSYDPVFLSQDAPDSPLNILDATSKYIRWNPLTLQPELIDMISGSQQHIISRNSGDAQQTEGSESFQITNPPKADMRLRVVAQWTQEATGVQTNRLLETTPISTFSYEHLKQSLPAKGTQIGSSTGWTIEECELLEESDDLPFEFDISWIPGTDIGISDRKASLRSRTLRVGIRTAFEYSQSREEILDIYMKSGMQIGIQQEKTETVEQIQITDLTVDVITPEWKYEHQDTLEIMHYAVGDKVQAFGRCWSCVAEHDATEVFTRYLYDAVTGETATTLWEPVAKQRAIDPRNGAYFTSDRGKRSIRYALNRLKRQVIKRSQCAEYSFEVPASVGLQMSTDHTCLIESRNLPGGQCVGKIVGIEHSLTNSRTSKITLAVQIGDDTASPTPVGGQAADYGITYSIEAADLNLPVDAYALPAVTPRVLEIENDRPQQIQKATDAIFFGHLNPVETISKNATAIRIYYEPLRQEDVISRRITIRTEPIHIARGINLSPDI